MLGLYNNTAAPIEYEASKNIAKKRLINLLTKDRTEYAGRVLDMLKPDLIKVIEPYVDIESEKLTVNIKRAGGNSVPVLVISAPFKDTK